MSKLLDRFRYFKTKGDSFADGHGQVYHTNRDWEDSYRQRWQFDKIVRSTHGVNCTGSCSWKIYVKMAGDTETQQTDYPRTRPDLLTTNHAAARAAQATSVSLQRQPPEIPAGAPSADRTLARGAGAAYRSGAGRDAIQNDPQKAQSYRKARGKGGFIRSNWKELNQLIAAANVWTIKTTARIG